MRMTSRVMEMVSMRPSAFLTVSTTMVPLGPRIIETTLSIGRSVASTGSLPS